MSFHTRYFEYFQNLAQLHKQIKQSVRLDLSEYADGNVSKAEFPLMIIEPPEFKVGGPNDDQICDEITGAFTIIANRNARSLSVDAQNQLMDDMLAIVKDILARMRAEVREYVHDGTNNSIVQHFHVRDSNYVAFITTQTIGYRCEFMFRNFNNYPVDSSVWRDL